MGWNVFILWQMLLPLWQMDWLHRVNYFILRFLGVKENLIPYVREMVFAHILFRDGLLTLMYIASFISVMKFWSSLPTILKVSKCSGMTSGVKMVINWEGGFRWSLNLSSNVLEDSPICTSLHSTLSHLNL